MASTDTTHASRARRSHLPPPLLATAPYRRRPSRSSRFGFRVRGFDTGCHSVRDALLLDGEHLAAALGRYHPRARLSQPGRAQDHARQRARPARPVQDCSGRRPVAAVSDARLYAPKTASASVASLFRTTCAQKIGYAEPRSTSTSRSSTNCGPRAAIT